jgi:16S rRNA (adenine1518-N6/adenine1519-N6)-dimethyltransferase
MLVKAQKSFGQHFLKDNFILSSINKEVKKVAENLQVIEIGPGMGALTEFLIRNNSKLYCIEVDKRCVAFLKETYRLNQNLEIIEADFLKLNLNDFIPEQALIVGNFPYNISSQIIFNTLDVYKKVPVLIGMFQKEMAARVAAKHGNKTYGIISILTQFYYDVEFLFEVPPTSFAPPPKVDSAVIKLTRKENIDEAFNYKLFKNIVKTSFNQRRKMMRSSLKSIAPTELLKETYFNLRPEQLSLEDFIQLTKRIEALKV